MKFWSLSGKLLQVVNTNQVANYHCVGSKDNRFLAVAAYTPEVRILEITREKNGLFKKANKIMTLQGHRVRFACLRSTILSFGMAVVRLTACVLSYRMACWTWRSTVRTRWP